LVGSTGKRKSFCNKEIAKMVTKFLKKRNTYWYLHAEYSLMKYWDTYDNFGRGMVREDLGVLGVDGGIILRWIFRKWDVGIWTGSG
jgi:hypothetical protein